MEYDLSVETLQIYFFIFKKNKISKFRIDNYLYWCFLFFSMIYRLRLCTYIFLRRAKWLGLEWILMCIDSFFYFVGFIHWEMQIYFVRIKNSLIKGHDFQSSTMDCGGKLDYLKKNLHTITTLIDKWQISGRTFQFNDTPCLKIIMQTWDWTSDLFSYWQLTLSHGHFAIESMLWAIWCLSMTPQEDRNFFYLPRQAHLTTVILLYQVEHT